MRIQKLMLILLSGLFSYVPLHAQCVLSITNLPDSIKVCRNTQIQLTPTLSITGASSPTILDTLWTPAAGLSDSSAIHPTVTLGSGSAQYVLSITSITTSNSVVNGNFSLVNTGFSSNYTDTSGPGSLWPEAHYAVVTNPFSVHPNFASFGDHTTGTGNMMVINGAGSPVNIWCQTISVIPNTQYSFSAWGASCTSTFPAQLQFQINGILLGTPLQLPATTGQWVQFTTTWFSGSDTSITICIYDQQTALSGNDFAIDDIAFQQICVARDSVYIQVSNLVPGISKTVSLGCISDTLNVTALNGGTLPDNYTWSWGDNSSDTLAKMQHIYASQGTYTIKLVESTKIGCKDSATTNIDTRHPLKAAFSQNMSTACQGQAVDFINTSVSSSTGGNPSYLWYFGNGDSSMAAGPSYAYRYSDTGAYNIMMVIKDFVPCNDTAYGTINLITKPSHYRQDSTFCGPNNDIVMGKSINNADSYLWNTGETSASIIPKTDGIHVVTTTNQCGSITDTVSILMYDCNNCLFVPNAFTPNDDGRNDKFHVRMLCPIKYYGIKIFSRFGQMVYSNYYISEGWDGRVNGIPADIGTYFYEIEYTADLPNAKQVFVKGDITLVR